MSTAELLAAIFGLLFGYGLIARWIGQRRTETPSPVNRDWVRANWPDILGVSPNASVEVIKAAYRLQREQYQPEKTHGLALELRSLAVRKTQELDAAYAWATGARSHGA
jgi:DnaJ-domain-containing protein 1